jgi:hypothetical protein
LSDLLPEMEFHAHNRLQLTIALLGGILLAYGITFLEPVHLHASASPSGAVVVLPSATTASRP